MTVAADPITDPPMQLAEPRPAPVGRYIVTPLDPGQLRAEAQTSAAGVEPSDSGDQPILEPHIQSVSAADSPHPAIRQPTPRHAAPGGEPSETADQVIAESHSGPVGGPVPPPADPIIDAETRGSPGRLGDTLLVIYSDALDDFEDLRKRTANRIDALRRVKQLADSPEEERLLAMLATITDLEKAATKDLENGVKNHPLGPWITAQTGIGLKQAGRLLGTLGDPYWHSRDNRPRTEGELNALCGYHVLPDGTAPRNRSGVKSNWNSKARSRAWCIADSLITSGVRKYDPKLTDKDGYRLDNRYAITVWGQLYLDARAKASTAVHNVQCQNTVRPVGGRPPKKTNGCGTQANPEWGAPGTPLRDGHVHARAMREVAKEVLRGLWLESKRLHEDQAS